MKKILTIILAIFVSLCIWITGYYYVYQWFIKDSNIEKKSEEPKIIEKVVEEKLEDIIPISSVISTETEAWRYLKKILEEKNEWKWEIVFKVNNVYFLNNLFNHNFFKDKKEQELNLTVESKNWEWTFLMSWKINGRAISIVGKYDSAYIYIDSFVVNGILSMINDGALNYFFDQLNWYIDYGSFNNKKISFIASSWIDNNIGKSQEEYYSIIMNWIVSLFDCNNKECKVNINDKLVDKIRIKLDDATIVTEKQKQSILWLSTRAIDYVSWSSLKIQESWNYHLSFVWDKLDFNFSVRFTPQEVKVDINRNQYVEKKQDEFVNDFINRNPLFTAILTNKDITKSLLE